MEIGQHNRETQDQMGGTRCSEIPGIHYYPVATHDLVASDSSLMVMLYMSVRHNPRLGQMDVKSAFVNSPLL